MKFIERLSNLGISSKINSEIILPLNDEQISVVENELSEIEAPFISCFGTFNRDVNDFTSKFGVRSFCLNGIGVHIVPIENWAAAIDLLFREDKKESI